MRYIPSLANAVEELRARGRSVRLLVAGDGECGPALRRCAPPGTTYLGMRNDISYLMRNADLYVGEGTTVLEAAAQGTPSLMSCSQALPADAEHAFAIFGTHTFQHMFLAPNKLAPCTPYTDAIGLLLDPSIRVRVSARAAKQIQAHSMDRYMPWLLRLAGGQNPPNLISVEKAHAMLVASGAISSLRRAAREMITHPQTHYALQLERAVGWNDFLALDEEQIDVLVPASRRAYP